MVCLSPEGSRTRNPRVDEKPGWSVDLLELMDQYLSVFIQKVAKHLARTYGNKAPEVAKLANITGSRWPVVGKRLSEEFPYIEAEVRYSIQEYACTVVDFLARRTRLAFLNAQAAADAIPKIADIMGKELQWSKAKKQVNILGSSIPLQMNFL